MSDSPQFLAAITEWLRANGEPTATAVSVEPYGSDWNGDTNGGFWSSFEITIKYIRADGLKAAKNVEGEDVQDLWAVLVSGYGVPTSPDAGQGEVSS